MAGGGRQQVGRQMKPLRYDSMVIGMKQYAIKIERKIKRVRKLGLKNRANVADPNTRPRPGIWYHHVGPGVNPYFVSDPASGDDDIAAY